MKNYLFLMENEDYTEEKDVLDLKTAASEFFYKYANNEKEKDLFLKSCESLNDSESISLLDIFLRAYGEYLKNIYVLGEKIY